MHDSGTSSHFTRYDEMTMPKSLTVAEPLPLVPTELPLQDIEALYVHVPFCFHKCHYCDFYSITGQSSERMDRFVELLLSEAAVWQRRASGIFRPRTIFFGGGTPSLLPLAAMRRLLVELRAIFDLSAVEEWTVEVNPATAEGDYCRMLREHGVDRLSFGAQSFHRGELAMLERHHDPDDVPRSLELARSAGFDRLNLDLIYAIPGQDLASWRASLDAALALGIRHISCYGLTYEPNTPMAVKKRQGLFKTVEEETELAMFRYTRSRLAEAGLPAYEISNYAQIGQECRHNLVYWSGGNYLSLGPSAASHVAGTRWRNRPHLAEWERAVEAGDIPAIDVERLTPMQRAGELAWLMLRLERGLNFADFADRTGLDGRTHFSDPLTRFVPAGLLRIDPDAIRLTPRGLELADALASEFLA
jgi:oxygen-independent coproporphyrinogen-3 oxidase